MLNTESIHIVAHMSKHDRSDDSVDGREEQPTVSKSSFSFKPSIAVMGIAGATAIIVAVVWAWKSAMNERLKVIEGQMDTLGKSVYVLLESAERRSDMYTYADEMQQTATVPQVPQVHVPRAPETVTFSDSPPERAPPTQNKPTTKSKLRTLMETSRVSDSEATE